MSNKVDGGSNPNVVGDGTPGQAPRDIQAELDAVGGPMVEPGQKRRTPAVGLQNAATADPASARGQVDSNQVNDLLNRAGLTGDASGVQNIAAQGIDGVAAAQAAAELLGPDGQSAIAAPTPPKIELTDDLKVGAETFVANMDQVVNDAFLKAGSFLGDAKPIATEDSDSFDAVNQMFFSGTLFGGSINGDAIRAEAEAALGESRDGMARDGGRNADPQAPLSDTLLGSTGAGRGTDALQGVLRELTGPGGVLEGAKPMDYDKTGMPKFNPNMTMTDVMGPENIKAILAGAVEQVISTKGAPRAGGSSAIPGVPAIDVRNLNDMSADMLLALFLKLNITDPNNSVETHNKLNDLGTELRQQSIDEAQKKSENAQAAMKEAQAYAEKMEVVQVVIQVIMIIIALVVTVFSFGAAAPLAIGGVTAGMTAMQAVIHVVRETISIMVQKAVDSIIQTIVVALITMVLQLINAGIESEKANKSADASEAQNGVERSRKQAEQQQQIIEDEGAIMKTIMESKNQMVDSVIKMLNAMFSTNAKVMSAGMSR